MTADPAGSPPTPAELADAAQAIARYNAAHYAPIVAALYPSVTNDHGR